MDKSLIVEVFVPINCGDGKDCEGKEGIIGTGYPVSLDLVITARHLFFPKPPLSYDDRYPARIRWHYHREQVSEADKYGWIDLPDNARVWVGKDHLDAILLRCPRPDSVVSWGILSERKPNDKMAWTSEGFPKSNKFGSFREPCSFGGQCFSKAPDESYFELSVLASPKNEIDWQGASGMPIFVGKYIIGIAQRVPLLFESKRLHAIPSWKLLEDPLFYNVLDYNNPVIRKIPPEIINWYDRLEQFKLDGQINEGAFQITLARVLGVAVDKIPNTRIRVLEALRDHLGEMSLNPDESHSEIESTDISTANEAQIHQILTALRYSIPVRRKLCHIWYILIPPGTVGERKNPKPFYLAETLISQFQWDHIMATDERLGDERIAQTNISISQIQCFLDKQKSVETDGAEIRLPFSHEWRFAFSAGGCTNSKINLKEPTLKQGMPTSLGLYDLINVIWQFSVSNPSSYERLGGFFISYEPWSENSLPLAYSNTQASDSCSGFRPVLEIT